MPNPPTDQRAPTPPPDWRPGEIPAPDQSVDAPCPGPAQGRERPRHRYRRALAVGALAAAAVALPAGASYYHALTKPGEDSTQARSVEWLRDMHLGFAVDRIEQTYYDHTQPALGGEVDPSLYTTTPTPTAPAAQPRRPPSGQPSSTTPTTAPHLPIPTPMATPTNTPFPGEGDWTAVRPGPDGTAPVYITRIRPNAKVTSLVDFVAWIDPTRASLQLFPGTDLPGGTWTTPPAVPADRWSSLLLASNGGFRMDGSRGGFYAEGRAAVPLRSGAASLVFYPDGTATVAQWGRDVGAGDLSQIDSVRQNLELLVDNGQPVPGIDTKDWGALIRNSAYVWRSGYGVTAAGAIIYVGGPGLTPRDLANTLIAAGAVRGMQGDINPDWVTANIYRTDPATGQCHGTPGLNLPFERGGMKKSGDRYLSTDTRDFVAVFSRG